MPAADADLRSDSPPSRLPFSPITKQHILHCSVHHWHPLFRTLTPKTRLVPIPPSFLAYLRADGIVLPPDFGSKPKEIWEQDDFEGSEDEEEQSDPSLEWPEFHQSVRAVMGELGGKVHPKLNWSAPKDATWIAATNTMECTSPNDIYLLLKSSDFVMHDLEQVFDDCEGTMPTEDIPYQLVLRKSVGSILTSMEFRCFVRDRTIIGICQRDQHHYDFLARLVPTLQRLISDFFAKDLKERFPDPDFVFDVYIPKPEGDGRVWLIDINPFAPRTDPLLFSWMELLGLTIPAENRPSEQVVDGACDTAPPTTADEELGYRCEFRIVKHDDPEAYSFSTPLYSAHKLPKDVVDAGMNGTGGIRDFLEHWRKVQEEAEEGASEASG